MTYEYSNINQHDALYNLVRAYPGGLEALAHRMGMLTTTLRSKTRPAVETHHVNFEELSVMIELSEEARVPTAFAPLHAFCWRHGHVAFQLPKAEQDPDTLLKHLVDVMSAEGALAAGLNKALATNGDINDREFDEIDELVMQGVMALVVLRQKVIEKHKLDMHSEVRAR